MEFYYHGTENDVLIIKADGGLNSETAGQFILELERLIDMRLQRIIVDCSGLDYISSYGLGMLLRLHKRMSANNGDVRLCSVKGIIPKALKATKLDQLFQMYDDVGHALEAFEA